MSRENGSGQNPSRPCSVCGKVYSVSGRKVRKHNGPDGEQCKGGQLYANKLRSKSVSTIMRRGWAGVFANVIAQQAIADIPEVRMWIAVLIEGVKDMVTAQNRARNHKYASRTSAQRYKQQAIESSREFCLGTGAADICRFIEIDPEWFRRYVLMIEKHYA